MPSQEMLKKLLEEFDDKEAQNREEINIVTLRVEELEKRISSSQQRLQKVSLDRQKVAEMMNRYSNGNLKNGTFTPANFAAALPPAAPAPSLPGAPSIAAAKPAATLTNLTPASTSASPAGAPTASAAALAAAPAAPAAPAVAAVPAGEPVPASEWGIVKAAPPTPIIFDPALPGGASPAAPFSSPSPAPQPFGAAPAVPSPAAGPSISSPVTSASAQAAATGSSETQDGASPEATGASAGSPEGAPALAAAFESTSPISSLSAASLFSSAATPSTSTSENSPFNLDAVASSGASPFTSSAPNAPVHTTPLSTPQSLPQSLMQSMPIGGGSGAQPPASSPSGPGKFDMMDLFAPLSGEEGESAEVVSEPAPEVAEQALAQNQFYSSPATATAGQVAQAANDPSATADPSLSTATSEHPSLDLGEDPAAPEAEEGDDTVKSINDALRGLFR